MMTTILGISGSLRGARYGIGSQELASDLSSLSDLGQLREYLVGQNKLIVEDFLAAGRAQQLPFDQVYRSLRRLSGRRGLSNSETVLAAALWGARQEEATIDHLSLSAHFLSPGTVRDEALLRDKLSASDGIILASPVYFGDRGSLVQSLLEFIAADPDLREHVAGKAYGGIAVGAKRNGGQETTLIYQLLDTVNLGFLGVGDSSETAAQYGGTSVGGDVGTAVKDDYGLNTSISTGRRVARLAHLLTLGRGRAALRDRMRIAVWMLQRDRGDEGRRRFQTWAEQIERRHPEVSVRIFDVPTDRVARCIACDVCPTSVGPKEVYRCIISEDEDFFVQHHSELLDADAILVGAYSPSERANVVSVYQQFIERTRYLRRDDYVFTDVLTAPFVISEVEARQNLHLRILTSMLRHHTVMCHPLLGMVHRGEIINADSLQRESDRFVTMGRTLLVGRLLAGSGEALHYNPIGYQISAAKVAEDTQKGLHRDRADQVRAGFVEQRWTRLVPDSTK